MSCSVIPRNGLVVIEVIEAKEARTKHGIVLPAVTTGNIFEIARVIAVGRGFPDAGKHVGTDDLKPGMLVLIKSGSRHEMQAALSRLEFDVGGKKTSLLNQQDILSIVDESVIAASTQTSPNLSLAQ